MLVKEKAPQLDLFYLKHLRVYCRQTHRLLTGLNVKNSWSFRGFMRMQRRDAKEEAADWAALG